MVGWLATLGRPEPALYNTQPTAILVLVSSAQSVDESWYKGKRWELDCEPGSRTRNVGYMRALFAKAGSRGGCGRVEFPLARNRVYEAGRSMTNPRFARA